MSCNILTDNRIDLKTNLPRNIGDFWLDRGTDKAQDLVRLFTRLSLQNNALKYIDYVEKLMSIESSHINGLPFAVKLSDLTIFPRNFNPTSYSSTARNGYPIDSEIPLRKQDYSLPGKEGIYLLDPETRKIWQSPEGPYFLWAMDRDLEDPNINIVFDTVLMFNQPEYAVELTGKVPTIILSKKGYLIYGLDFRVEDGYLIFVEPLINLFDVYIHIQACYEKRTTLFGFPFSVDPETPGVEYISKFLRNNSSAKNLEKALSQVVGYSSVKDTNVVVGQTIPEGTVFVSEKGEVSTVTQDFILSSNYSKDTFPGDPVKVIEGTAPEFLGSMQKSVTFLTPAGDFVINNQEVNCVIEESDPENWPIPFVAIYSSTSPYLDTQNITPSEQYINTLRKREELRIFEESGEVDPLLANTFSNYLINKYTPGNSSIGIKFLVPILQEYISTLGQNALLIQFSSALNLEQIQAGMDFLKTHTPANAIILVETV